jgi:hypothetical protein
VGTQLVPAGYDGKKSVKFHAMPCNALGLGHYPTNENSMFLDTSCSLCHCDLDLKLRLICLEVGAQYHMPKPLFYLGEETGNEAVIEQI